MKKKPALIAAFLTTFVIAAAMLLVGFSAFFNPDSVPVSNSPDSAASAAPVGTTANISAVSASAATDQVKQLQDLIAQYQQREQQYQQQEKQLQAQAQQLQDQLNKATSMVGQYQNLLAQLQARGVIAIDQSGQISIPRRRGD
jgi:septal ring factor EnvC (AmiA/AmiB activator)